MKIGILNFINAKNYGAVLQSFALKTLVEQMGMEPYIINRYAGATTKKQFYSYSFLPKFILGRLKWVCFDKFSEKYLIPKTKEYTTTNSLHNFDKNENFDIVIVGSDQVWRLEFSAVGYNYFLDFIKNKNTRKIAYAASFGTDKWTANKTATDYVKNLLENFTLVTVREKSGVKICSEIFNIHAKCVLDPTLLLNQKNYESLLLKNYQNIQENYLISYFLDNDKDKLLFFNNFANENKLKYMDIRFTYPYKNIFSLRKKFGEKNFSHISVPKWLSKIRNSKYVVSNSFHATVFSIIFKKQFLVTSFSAGGSERMKSLLRLLGLEDRYFNDISEVSMSLLSKPINYDKVYAKLTLEREKSISLLRNAITKNNIFKN